MYIDQLFNKIAHSLLPFDSSRNPLIKSKMSYMSVLKIMNVERRVKYF